MKLVVPLTLVIIVMLLFFQFRNAIEVLILLLSIPFALVGSVWLMWLLDYRVSTAVWVGIIALVGLAAQTGIVMIVYIDNAFRKRQAEGRINDLQDIIAAHMEGNRPARAPEAHDGLDDAHRARAAAVGDELGVGRHEADRGAHGGRPADLRVPDAGDHSGRRDVLAARRAALAAPRGPRARAPARSQGRPRRALASGAALAVALAVARIYVAVPAGPFALGELAAAGLFLGGPRRVRAAASWGLRRCVAPRTSLTKC